MTRVEKTSTGVDVWTARVTGDDPNAADRRDRGRWQPLSREQARRLRDQLTQALIDVDALERHAKGEAGYGSRTHLQIPLSLFNNAIAALRQQQEERTKLLEHNEDIMQAVLEKDAEIRVLSKALADCMEALESLDPGCLGFANDAQPGGISWPIRDELIHGARQALEPTKGSE